MNTFTILKRLLNTCSRRHFCVGSAYNKGRNVKLDYDIVNENTKHNDHAPIIISHGLFGTKKNWRSLSLRINVMSGRKVITYDAVNHGTSSHHPDMSYTDLAEDLVMLLDQLEVDRAIMLGHSMGGKTVMTTALTYPERTDKLIVLDVSPTVSKSMGEVNTYMKFMYHMDMTKIKSRQDVEKQLNTVVLSPSVLQFLMTNLVSSRDGFSWRINLEAMMHNYHHTHAFPSFAEDVVYKGPTLFVGGARSFYITEEEHPDIYHRFPHAQIKMVADAGHWVHSEKPAEFLNCISDLVHVHPGEG